MWIRLHVTPTFQHMLVQFFNGSHCIVIMMHSLSRMIMRS
jgi:hypothetical protein